MRAAARGTGRVLALLAALVLVAGCSAAGAADKDDHVETVAAYDDALAPLKERSDVLEKRFAEVQGEGYTGPEQVRDVLSDIIPEYAALLEKTRDIEVEGAALEEAHRVLLASLERQQEGLELALEALGSDDSMRMVRAGRALEEAQRLVEEHRRLLAQARRVG